MQTDNFIEGLDSIEDKFIRCSRIMWAYHGFNSYNEKKCKYQSMSYSGSGYRYKFILPECATLEQVTEIIYKQSWETINTLIELYENRPLH